MAPRGSSGWKADNHLPQFGRELQDAFRDVVSKATLDIQGNAVSNAPVSRSGGRLKGSIQVRLPDAMSSEIEGVIGSNVEYAAYVELGTGVAGAGSSYPYPRSARYTMSWPGMTARAFIANAAKRVEGPFTQACQNIGQRLPRKV